MKGIWLWPIVRVTPVIAVLCGWAMVLLAVAGVAGAFATFTTVMSSTAVYALALTSAAASLLLAGYATWLSRRRQTPSLPPRA
jgi:predicted phage tail protein